MTERFNQDWVALAHKIGYATEREMLEDMYVKQRLSLHQIAVRLGCGPHCIHRHLRALEIDRRGRGGHNNYNAQTKKLFLLDQRVVLNVPMWVITGEAHVSNSLLYKYRRMMGETTHELLHP